MRDTIAPRLFEIGNSLREARERQGLDFASLEADTKVRAKYLRALEEERFDVLPAESYARGFLEVYATRLRLDSQLYADEFDLRFARGDGDGQGIRRIRGERRLRFEASALAFGLLGILAVTVLVIAAWQFSGGSDDGDPSSPAAPEPAAAPEPTAPPAPDPVSAPPAPSAADAPAPVAEEAELEVRALVAGARVTIRRNGRNGRVLFADTLADGETHVFTGLRLHAAFRDPSSFAVRVNTEVLPIVPRRLVATADGWRRG